MKTCISENRIFRGEKALIMENDTLRAVILPERGAKIASLRLLPPGFDAGGASAPGPSGDSVPVPAGDFAPLPAGGFAPVPAGGFVSDSRSRSGSDSISDAELRTADAGTEVLAQITTKTYGSTLEYGGEFGEEDGSGFDDMLTTIDACELDIPRIGPVRLPDHGEAWSRPWEYRIDGESVVLSIGGIALPYRFTKRLSLGAGELQAEYTAVNRSAGPLPFQWAAHALFQISPGARLEIPSDMHTIYSVCPGRALPEKNRTYDYPHPFGPEGIDLSLMPPRNKHGMQKYWFTEALTEGRCSITDIEHGFRASLIFDPADLPWLGIWVNEGGWHGGYNLGIEPSTCWLDSPAAGMEKDRCLLLGPGETKRWGITLRTEIP